MLLWDAWSWHCIWPSGRAQVFFPPTRHDVPNLSASITNRPRRVVKSSRAARLKLPQRPQTRPLYDAGTDTSRKLLPSHRTFTPMCVSMNRLSSVLFMKAFPSSLYGAVTLLPFTLIRIFWPRLIFKVPTYRKQKLFDYVIFKGSLCLYCPNQNMIFDAWFQVYATKWLRTSLFWVYYIASGGNFLLTFRYNLSVPSSGFENPKESL